MAEVEYLFKDETKVLFFSQWHSGRPVVLKARPWYGG